VVYFFGPPCKAPLSGAKSETLGYRRVR